MGAGRNINPKEKALLDFYYNKSDLKEIALNSEHRQTVTGNPHAVTKADVGLGNVDNTADANKPISDDTQNALDAAELDRLTLLKIDCSNSPLTGQLNLVAGTASVAPVKLSSGLLLTTPIPGAIEYSGNKIYITNKSLRKVIDRTSDVKLTTTTVENTTTETTVYTANVPANSWVVGNALIMNIFGNISNTAVSNDVIINVKVNNVTIATVTSDGRKLTDNCWEIAGKAIIRTVGASGTMAWIISMKVDGQDRDYFCDVVTNDTRSALDITVTATWVTENASNVFNCIGGFMEYKN